MTTNVIAFTARPSTVRPRPVQRRTRDNVISLAQWIGRATPHRTATGAHSTTHVLMTPGDPA